MPNNHNIHQQQQAYLQQIQMMQQFWHQQMVEIQNIGVEANDGNSTPNSASRSGSGSTLNHQLPLARIKRVMKCDDSVSGPSASGGAMMISSESPQLLCKAAELFILDLTLRAWQITEKAKRRTLQINDVKEAVWTAGATGADYFDFLVDLIPRPMEDTTMSNRNQQAMMAAWLSQQQQQQQNQILNSNLSATQLGGDQQQLGYYGGPVADINAYQQMISSAYSGNAHNQSYLGFPGNLSPNSALALGIQRPPTRDNPGDYLNVDSNNIPQKNQ